MATNASTHQAYLNLIEGRSEIGLLARQPSPKELQLASSKQVELEVTPCALDAFVFLVNNANPIRNLTVQQIRDIYSSQIRHWQEVGDWSGRITTYQREENSGSQELMRQLVMQNVRLEIPDKQLIGYIMSSPYLKLNTALARRPVDGRCKRVC